MTGGWETLDKDGAICRRGAASSLVGPLHAIERALPRDRAGLRVNDVEALVPFVAQGSLLWSLAAERLGSRCRTVRAILFDKTSAANWSLGWHQDRTICVRRKMAAEGFGPWTTKAGLPHVAPPIELLSRMLTLRVHLDPVGERNAPLLIAPGSHRLGPIAEQDVSGVVARCGIRPCHADVGDVWIYATPILHASKASQLPTRRRVLQLDFSGDDLPAGLEWRGVGRIPHPT